MRGYVFSKRNITIFITSFIVTTLIRIKSVKTYLIPFNACTENLYETWCSYISWMISHNKLLDYFIILILPSLLIALIITFILNLFHK
ncbi:hypothetical protein U732_422 [Clostridium argentinense CDC 2741]|uniref:Uncharacterized protein n=1 Tax=Clostridium argentinense CDC 2741 TaxID=1418104 RepID=A0A0C1QTN4_9CLOT|nr:hypothetical protein RSJ17_04895 [Clostridium argentinense]KIE44342.1 hypothetical protein U732_422 [Clostridium argentinense CDC 2741]